MEGKRACVLPLRWLHEIAVLSFLLINRRKAREASLSRTVYRLKVLLLRYVIFRSSLSCNIRASVMKLLLFSLFCLPLCCFALEDDIEFSFENGLISLSPIGDENSEWLF